jgi:hypothetical protein
LLRRFGRLSNRERLLLGEAVIWLMGARLALTAVPFARLAAWFGTLRKPGEAGTPESGMPPDNAVARDVGWAVTRAARYVPFRAVCLPQAIAAKAMLNRRRIANVMHFGVARKVDERLQAHAWLDAAGEEVTGFPVAPDMVEVARFV